MKITGAIWIIGALVCALHDDRAGTFVAIGCANLWLIGAEFRNAIRPTQDGPKS